jgi:hypothetical protein
MNQADTEPASTNSSDENSALVSAERRADAAAQVILDALHGAFFHPTLRATLPALLGRLLCEAALTFLRSPAADESVRSLLGAAPRFFAARGNAPLSDIAGKDAQALLRKLAVQPYVPSRTLLVQVLSRPPIRRLNRELMIGTLLDYSRRLRSTLEGGGAGKGIGALSRLASEAVKKSTSALGAIAPGVTAAVSDEFERQMQRRAAEFADSAVDDMVQRIAATLTDPQRRAEHNELKLSLLDFVLTLRCADVAAELSRMDLPAVAAELRAFALSWLARESAARDLEAAMSLVWGEMSSQTEPISAALLLVRPALQAFLRAALLPSVQSGALQAALL